MTRPAGRRAAGPQDAGLRSAGLRSTVLRRADLVPALRERSQYRRSAIMVRIVQLLSGIAVLLIAPSPSRLIVLVVLAGLLVAVISPARSGPALVLGGGVWAWLSGYVTHGEPPVLRVVLFAVALFALHDSTSLAAAVPLSCRLRREAAVAWLRRSALALAIAALFIATSYLIGAVVEVGRSNGLQLAGMAGSVLVAGVVVWLFSRRPR